MTSVSSIGQFSYCKPGSLQETLKIMAEKGAGARILAGGTDLILQIKQKQKSPSLVVDVKGIGEMNRLEYTEALGLCIGAAVPLSKILSFPIVGEKYSMLYQACSVIGSMQIRNRGSLGGNICNAAPSADSAPALLCLGAKVIIASEKKTRIVNLDDFFVGPGITCLEHDELLIEIEIPNPPKQSAGCYLRHTTREEMDISVAGVAAYIELSPELKVPKEVRIAMSAVASTPLRAHSAEALLVDRPITEKTIEQAAQKTVDETKPISDVRASAEYRREIVKVLTRRALRKDCEMLGIDIQG
jgi:CO/xanthine dehydrogenase FAD-binding subunit